VRKGEGFDHEKIKGGKGVSKKLKLKEEEG
jgi:hypothetical protein